MIIVQGNFIPYDGTSTAEGFRRFGAPFAGCRRQSLQRRSTTLYARRTRLIHDCSQLSQSSCLWSRRRYGKLCGCIDLVLATWYCVIEVGEFVGEGCVHIGCLLIYMYCRGSVRHFTFDIIYLFRVDVMYTKYCKYMTQHGATYTCDVEFSSNELVEGTNWVIDIGKASNILSSVLSKYNLKNLDEVFPNGEMTTTEFMCKIIYEEVAEQIRAEVVDFRGEICVKLWESHKAWASYMGKV